tara:strand:+ start:47 stop:253 length:207 start_codon:yes stop_codon:yes gene_type:complete
MPSRSISHLQKIQPVANGPKLPSNLFIIAAMQSSLCRRSDAMLHANSVFNSIGTVSCCGWTANFELLQ